MSSTACPAPKEPQGCRKARVGALGLPIPRAGQDRAVTRKTRLEEAETQTRSHRELLHSLGTGSPLLRVHCGYQSRRVHPHKGGAAQPAQVRPTSRSAGPRAPAAVPRPKSGRRTCPAFLRGPYRVARTSRVPRAQPCWGERSRGRLHPAVAHESRRAQGAWPAKNLCLGGWLDRTTTPPWPPPPLSHVTFGSAPAPPRTHVTLSPSSIGE